LKIYISSDQEGVSGIATRSRDAIDQAENKRLQTLEMVAVCEAILEFDPESEIVVNDSHGKGLNIDFEQLPEEVELVRQSPEILDQMYGIDSSYDGFMFFAHAMRGTLGALLSHVWEVQDLMVNGKRLGEAGIAAYLASYHGVPFIFSSGDDHYQKEVLDLSPTTETVVVKHGMGRYVARNTHPRRARKLIAEGTKRAMRRLKAGEIVPVSLPDPPIRLEMRFGDTGAADAAHMMPGVERLDGRTTLFVADDIETAYKAFYAQTRLQRGRLIQ
jgi:D-amino peptidase